MSSNMEKIISFRVSNDLYEKIDTKAKVSGCYGVSEYMRRKINDEEGDNMRNTILFILDLCLFNAAYNNVMIEINHVDVGKLAPVINEYKLSLVDEWNKKHGIV